MNAGFPIWWLVCARKVITSAKSTKLAASCVASALVVKEFRETFAVIPPPPGGEKNAGPDTAVVKRPMTKAAVRVENPKNATAWDLDSE